MQQHEIQAAAERLYQAEKEATQVRQISLDHPDITIEDAYAIQKAGIALKIAAGRKIIGHKIGLTSKAMQQSSQIDEPDYGTLLDDMLYADGSDINIDKFVDPMLEVELAFILKDTLQGENVSLTDVLSATEYVIPTIELIDARCHRLGRGFKNAVWYGRKRTGI